MFLTVFYKDFFVIYRIPNQKESLFSETYFLVRFFS